MRADSFDSSIEEVERRAADLQRALDERMELLGHARRRLAAGASTLPVIEEMFDAGGHDKRVRINHAIAAYEHAAMRLRGAMARILVEEGGLTLTALAGKLRVSRSMATRLYLSDESARRSERESTKPTRR